MYTVNLRAITHGWMDGRKKRNTPIKKQIVNLIKSKTLGFPGRIVDKNRLPMQGTPGSIPGLGRSHVLWNNKVHAAQLLSPWLKSSCSATRRHCSEVNGKKICRHAIYEKCASRDRRLGSKGMKGKTRQQYYCMGPGSQKDTGRGAEGHAHRRPRRTESPGGREPRVRIPGRLYDLGVRGGSGQVDVTIKPLPPKRQGRKIPGPFSSEDNWSWEKVSLTEYMYFRK